MEGFQGTAKQDVFIDIELPKNYSKSEEIMLTKYYCFGKRWKEFCMSA